MNFIHSNPQRRYHVPFSLRWLSLLILPLPSQSFLGLGNSSIRVVYANTRLHATTDFKKIILSPKKEWTNRVKYVCGC